MNKTKIICMAVGAVAAVVAVSACPVAGGATLPSGSFCPLQGSHTVSPTCRKWISFFVIASTSFRP